MSTADFSTALSAQGLMLEAEPVADSEFHRAHVDGHKQRTSNGWYVLDVAGKRGAFGDHKAGSHHVWSAKKDDNSKYKHSPSTQPQKLFSSAKEANPKHPYLVAKGIPAYGIRQEGQRLVIPLRDVFGGIHSLQYIDYEGNKKFLKGYPKKGFFTIVEKSSAIVSTINVAEDSKNNPTCYINTQQVNSGSTSGSPAIDLLRNSGSPAVDLLRNSKFPDTNTEKVIYICEGYATAVSICEATNATVYAALDAGNLLPVAENLKNSLRDDTQIIIAADYDTVGLSKAKAVSATLGCLYTYPELKGHDFNDMSKAAGPEAVQRKLGVTIREELQSAPSAWEEDLILTKDGAPSNRNGAEKNVAIYLSNLHEFSKALALNEFSSETVWVSPAPWHTKKAKDFPPNGLSLNNDDSIHIKTLLDKYNFFPSTNAVIEGARRVALSNSFHPIKQYFRSIAPWDGINRLERFFPDYCGSKDSSYEQELGKKIFTAIVSRVYKPGCKFDYFPILMGTQGRLKSTLVETIAIHEDWYADNLGDVSHKDVVLRMRSKLIIESPELSIFKKADYDTVKAFLSRKVDRDRMSHEKLATDYPRQCIFMGTANGEAFLNDPTGGRRMWPIELTTLDIEAVKKDLKQLYAQALVLFKEGEPLYFDEDTEALAEEERSDFYQIDEWENLVSAWITQEKLTRLTGSMVWEDCLKKDITYFERKDQKRIASILRHLDFHRKKIRMASGKIVSGYVHGGTN